MRMQRGAVAVSVAAMVLLALPAGLAAAGEIEVQAGQKVAFLGDSITQQGAGALGYVTLVMRGLEANGVKAARIAAGISGHKSDQMLGRLQKDVLDKKPDWMTLSCGVNDVWHGSRGVPLDQYTKNITEIVTRAQQAGVKVVILTSTMITEDANAPNNTKLADYNKFLVKLAGEKDCLLADLNADMQKIIAAKAAQGEKPGRLLTSDGVHMNPFGDAMMARGVLRAFGLDDEQIAKAEKDWATIDYNWRVTLDIKMSFDEYKRFMATPESDRNALLDEARKKASQLIIDRVKQPAGK